MSEKFTDPAFRILSAAACVDKDEGGTDPATLPRPQIKAMRFSRRVLMVLAIGYILTDAVSPSSGVLGAPGDDPLSLVRAGMTRTLNAPQAIVLPPNADAWIVSRPIEWTPARSKPSLEPRHVRYHLPRAQQSATPSSSPPPSGDDH